MTPINWKSKDKITFLEVTKSMDDKELEKLKEEKIKKEDAADGIEEATEGQLRFKFKTEEV